MAANARKIKKSLRQSAAKKKMQKGIYKGEMKKKRKFIKI